MPKKGDIDKKEEKKEVHEIFEVKKDGEEKIVESSGLEKEKPATSEQIKKESKMFKKVLIVIAVLSLVFLAVILLVNYFNHFSVGGVSFEIDRTTLAGKTIYKTTLPGKIDDNGKFVMGIFETGKATLANYRLYLRTDPRILDKIPFHERITQVKKENVIKIGEGLDCDGKGILAVANILKMYEVIGGNIIKDANASCDMKGRYGWINIQKGEETSLERIGPACFNVYVKDCEILPATEKFILETLIEVNKRMGISSEIEEE